MKMRALQAAIGTAAVAVFGATPLFAASINYGDFVGSTVVFQAIIEDSITDPLPLYGAPTVIGDQLDFGPTAFGSFSANGNADITDGLLRGSVTAKAGYSLDSFSFTEFGDYTLQGGSGTTGTAAYIGQTFFVTITEVDGVALGVNAFTVSASSIFTSDGDFFLPAEAGTAVAWAGAGSIDLAAALADRKAEFPQITGNAVTGIEFTSNNTLVTTSESGTVSFIQKKDVQLSIVSIPEPASLSLIGLGAAVLLRRRRI